MLPPERSDSLPALEQSQKPREFERVLLHPVTLQYENKVRSGSSRRFFEVQFVRLLYNKHRALLVAKHDHV